MEKGKTKRFWESHKEKITIGCSLAFLTVGGVVLGYKLREVTLPDDIVKLDKNVLAFLKSADQAYKGKRRWANISMRDTPLRIDELGKLGEGFLQAAGTKPNQTYTHFLAIGEIAD